LIVLFQVRWAAGRIFRPANLFNVRPQGKTSWSPSSTREDIIIPDGDFTLAKVSSDPLHQSCLLAWDGQSEYGGEGVTVDIVADSIPLPLSPQK